MSRILQFPAPVCEPIADLCVSKSRGVSQVFLLAPRWIRIFSALHQPLLQLSLNVRCKELLREFVVEAIQRGPGASDGDEERFNINLE